MLKIPLPIKKSPPPPTHTTAKIIIPDYHILNPSLQVKDQNIYILTLITNIGKQMVFSPNALTTPLPPTPPPPSPPHPYF